MPNSESVANRESQNNGMNMLLLQVSQSCILIR